MNKTLSYSQTRVSDLIITAMLISLIFVTTLFVNIKLPITANGGLIHLGTGMLFIASIVFGPKKGAMAGALGMGLFDLISGWTLWAPFTFITRGIQGYIVGKIAWANGNNGNNVALNIVAMLCSMPFMIAGYYICERVLFGNWIIPAASVPGDLVQNFVGLAAAIPVCIMLKKIAIFK